MILKTRNVFIDTQAFVMAELNFNSRSLDHFADLCNLNELTHIATSIVVKEIQDHIYRQVEESVAAFNTFKRKAKFLENTNNKVISELFKPINQEQIKEHAIKMFKQFLNKSNCNILTLEGINPELAFNLYFNKLPPFQGGKKKSEFPDAFNLLALEKFLAPREYIYIISQDKDLIAFCENNSKFIIIENLNKLLDLYNTHHTTRTNFIKNIITQELKAIEKNIKQQLQNADVYNESSWEDSEVDSFYVTSIDGFEPDIISIDDEHCLCSLSLEVTYTVTVIGPDFLNGTYDKETGKIYTFDDTIREEEDTFNITVEIDLDYKIINEEFKINNLDINVLGLKNGIAVCVEESASEYY